MPCRPPIQNGWGRCLGQDRDGRATPFAPRFSPPAPRFPFAPVPGFEAVQPGGGRDTVFPAWKSRLS